MKNLKNINKLVFCLTLIAACFLQANAQVIYVSPTGSDTNSGTQSEPVKTFQKGADLAKNSSISIVEFADGEYFFDSTVVLNASYNGITFRSAANANPTFTSLVKVTNWTIHSGNIFKADLPVGIGQIRYLHDKNTNWMERSATQSFSTTELAGGDDGGCIECNNYTQSTQSDMSNILIPSGFSNPDWTYASQYDLRANTLPWHLDIVPITSYNSGQNRLYTAVPALYDLRRDVEEVAPTAWILNSLEGIYTPGEWACLNNKIYLYPTTDTSEIYVPTLTELIRLDDGTINGNAAVSNPVQNITFDGITFTGGDYRIIESNDVMAQHDWMVVDESDALLRIRNASSITVQNCSFIKSGGTGLRVDRYAQNIDINNSIFSYLGRGGINIAGRGPGYGDVSKSNNISYNYIESIGMENWASVAIMLDNSSNNHVHHNFIKDTYFTAIASVGPRQLMFAAWTEGADAFYVGREFHFWEIEPSIVNFMANNGGTLVGSQEAMRFVYNYDNRIEENALIDVCTGKNMFVNGQIYISGSQRSTSASDIKTNFVERNYLYDSYNHSVNDYAIYSDSDQDDCNYIGNMINGVDNADLQPEEAPIILAFNQWAETENPGMGQILLQSNLSTNVTHCNNLDCSHTIGFDFVENDPIQNGVGGTASNVNIYQQMYLAICDENFPQTSSIPGAQTVRNELSNLILSFGGAIPDCGLLSTKEIESDRRILVYPNPNNGNFTLETGIENGYMQILSLEGRILNRKGFSSDKINIDVSDLPQGIYFVKVSNPKSNFSKTEKIIKY